MRDVLLEIQLNTQENKNSTAAGQAQGLTESLLGLCPALPAPADRDTDTDTDTDTDLKQNVLRVRQMN